MLRIHVLFTSNGLEWMGEDTRWCVIRGKIQIDMHTVSCPIQRSQCIHDTFATATCGRTSGREAPKLLKEHQVTPGVIMAIGLRLEAPLWSAMTDASKYLSKLFGFFECGSRDGSIIRAWASVRAASASWDPEGTPVVDVFDLRRPQCYFKLILQKKHKKWSIHVEGKALTGPVVVTTKSTQAPTLSRCRPRYYSRFALLP